MQDAMEDSASSCRSATELQPTTSNQLTLQVDTDFDKISQLGVDFDFKLKTFKRFSLSQTELLNKLTYEVLELKQQREYNQKTLVELQMQSETLGYKKLNATSKCVEERDTSITASGQELKAVQDNYEIIKNTQGKLEQLLKDDDVQFEKLLHDAHLEFNSQREETSAYISHFKTFHSDVVNEKERLDAKERSLDLELGAILRGFSEARIQHQNELQLSQETLGTLQDRLMELREKNEKVESKYENITSNNNEKKQNLEKTLLEKLKSLAELETNSNSLYDCIKEKTVTLNSMENTNEELKSDIQLIESEIEQMSSKKFSLTKELENLSATMDSIKDSLVARTQAVSVVIMAENNQPLMLSEKKRLSDELERICGLAGNEVEANGELEVAIKNSEKAIASELEKIENLNSLKLELEEKCRAIEDDIEKESVDKISVEEAVTELQSIANVLENECACDEEKIAQIEENIAELNFKETQLQSEFSKIDSQLQSLKERIRVADMNSVKAGALSKMQKKRENLQKELDLLKGTPEAQDNVARVQMDLEILLKQLEQLKSKPIDVDEIETPKKKRKTARRIARVQAVHLAKEQLNRRLQLLIPALEEEIKTFTEKMELYQNLKEDQANPSSMEKALHIEEQLEEPIKRMLTFDGMPQIYPESPSYSFFKKVLTQFKSLFTRKIVQNEDNVPVVELARKVKHNKNNALSQESMKW